MDDEGSLFDELEGRASVWSTCASLRLALAAPRNGVFRDALAKAPDSCRGEAAFRVCAGVVDEVAS